MIQCILFALEEHDYHKIAKLSTRRFIRAYEIASEILKITPLVTHNGNGIFDVRRNIRRMAGIKYTF